LIHRLLRDILAMKIIRMNKNLGLEIMIDIPNQIQNMKWEVKKTI